MEKTVIAAMARNRTIGRNNTLPWHIPEDLQLFKETTMGCPMIMGRGTFESLPGLLAGRRHIVLTANRDYQAAGAEIAHSWEEAFSLCKEADKVFIIGGEKIFTQAIDKVDSLQLTLLHRDVEGDRFFPEFETKFTETARREYHGGSEDFSVLYYRKTPPA